MKLMNKKGIFAAVTVLLLAALLLAGAAAGAAADTPDPVAQIDRTGTGYATLQEAQEAAVNGDTITLLTDISYEYPEGPVFKNGTYGISDYSAKVLVLNLNGKTISAKIDNTFTGTSRDLIFNGDRGDLTVTGNGKIEITESNDTAWGSSMSIFGNTGKLTIQNGTFANNGQESMSYVVDNRVGYNGGDAEVIINDGILSCPVYTAVRLLNQAPETQPTLKCLVTINGGNISGKRCFYLQQYNTTSVGYSELTVNGGTMTAAQRFAQFCVSGLTTDTKADIQGGDISIVAGAFGDEAVFFMESVTTASGYEGCAAVTVTSGKVTANGNPLFKQVSGKETALTGAISGGVFDCDPTIAYLTSGYSWEKDTGEVIKITRQYPTRSSPEEPRVVTENNVGRGEALSVSGIPVDINIVKYASGQLKVDGVSQVKSAIDTVYITLVRVDGATETPVKELASPIPVSVTIPSDWLDTENLNKYSVLHGKATSGNSVEWEMVSGVTASKVPGEDNVKFSFQTKYFSPFVIVELADPVPLSYSLIIPSDISLRKNQITSDVVKVVPSSPGTPVPDGINVTLSAETGFVEDDKTTYLLKQTDSVNVAKYNIAKTTAFESGNLIRSGVTGNVLVTSPSDTEQSLYFRLTADGSPAIAGIYTGTLTFTATVAQP